MADRWSMRIKLLRAHPPASAAALAAQAWRDLKLKLPEDPVALTVHDRVGDGLGYLLDVDAGMWAPFTHAQAGGSYCVDFEGDVLDGTPLTATLHLADPADPALADKVVNYSALDRVNYILNQDWAALGYTALDVQNAIWNLTDDYFIQFDPAASAIVSDAVANGGGFVPGPGQAVGIIVAPVQQTDPETGEDVTNYQNLIYGAPFDALAAFLTEDPNWSSVVALLGVEEGTIGGTNPILDESPIPRYWLVSGDGGGRGYAARFGANGLAVNPYNSSNCVVQTPAEDAFDFGAGDFTLEGWANLVHPPSGGAWHALMGNHQGDAGTWGLWVRSYSGSSALQGTLKFPFVSGAAVSGATDVRGIGWFHFAVSRQGDHLRLFVNGALDGEETLPEGTVIGVPAASAPSMHLGGLPDGDAGARMRGYLDEVRITKGVCRYAAPFTPPTTAFWRR